MTTLEHFGAPNEQDTPNESSRVFVFFVRTKLSGEAAKPDLDMRHLVCHVHLLNCLYRNLSNTSSQPNGEVCNDEAVVYAWYGAEEQSGYVKRPYWLRGLPFRTLTVSMKPVNPTSPQYGLTVAYMWTLPGSMEYPVCRDEQAGARTQYTVQSDCVKDGHNGGSRWRRTVPA